MLYTCVRPLVLQFVIVRRLMKRLRVDGMNGVWLCVMTDDVASKIG